MKIKSMILAAILCLSNAVYMQAQDDQAKQEAQKKWEAYMTPGAMHKMLANSNGEWDEELTIWMAPGVPAQHEASSCVNTMIMGDRYQQSFHHGTMGGMPFEGTSVVAYDNAKKIFMSTWIDNMGTGITYLEGPWDDAKKTIHFSGTMVDPMSGASEKMRQEFKIVDDDNQLITMYVTQNGKEFKNMEIKLSRRK